MLGVVDSRDGPKNQQAARMRIRIRGEQEISGVSSTSNRDGGQEDIRDLASNQLDGHCESVSGGQAAVERARRQRVA
jgi:hypothetical protein